MYINEKMWNPFVLLFILSPCIGYLIEGPSDSYTSVGQQLTLICRSNTPVFWRYRPPDPSLPGPERCDTNIDEHEGWHKIVDVDGKVTDDYTDQFRFESDPNVERNLIMLNASYELAGCYACMEVEVGGKRVGQVLTGDVTVVDSTSPSFCLSDTDIKRLVITDNFCGSGLDEDRVNLTCNLNFKGNIPPRVVTWTVNEGEGVTSETKEYFNRAVLSFIVLPASRLIGTSVSCVWWENSTSDQPPPQRTICYTEPSYLYIRPTDTRCMPYSRTPVEGNCFIDTNLQNCKFSWYMGTNSTPFHDGQILLIDNTRDVNGEYTCNVTCSVRERSCDDVTSTCLAVKISSVGGLSTDGWIGISVSVMILGTLLGVLTTFLVIHLRRKSKRDYESDLVSSNSVMSQSSITIQ